MRPGEPTAEAPNRPGPKEPRGGRVGIAGTGGKGAARKPDASKRRGRPRWWHSIEDTDPITLEPLSKLEVPPFGLRVEDGSHTHLFDGRVLAMYLVSSGQFLNPLTNVPLERADCERLDGHLRDNRLGKPCVATVFDEVQRRGEESRQVRSLREEASLIMSAIFSQGISSAMPSSQEMREVRRRAGRPVAPRPPAEARQMGAEGLVLYDDDWGMVPEAPPRPEVAFPELPSGGDAGPPTHSWHSPGLGGPLGFRGPPLGGESEGTEGPTASGNEPPPGGAGGAPLRQWGQIAAGLNSNTAEWAVRPSAGPRGHGQGAHCAERRPLTEEEEARMKRRLQLAEAFGVSDPERPGEFLLQSAAQSYSTESLAFARKFPGRAQAIEAALENFISSGRSRMSLLSASKVERKVTHELAQLYGIVTCSFGSGSGRQVDLFRPSSSTAVGTPSSSAAAPPPTLCRPPVLLSEAAALSDEALEAAAGGAPEEGYPEELLLYDVDVPEGSLPGFFHGLDVVQVEARPGEGLAVYALKFLTKGDLARARERAAGGVKGAFRVLCSSAAPGAQAAGEAQGAAAARDKASPAGPSRPPRSRPQAKMEAAEPPVDPEALKTLQGMGFSRNRCVRALHHQAPGADDVEGAVAWLLAHEGSPELNAPLLLPRRSFEGRSAHRIFQGPDAVELGNSWETLLEGE